MAEERQPLESQRGEIEFRRLLVRQQVEGQPVFGDEFDAEGIRPILEQRMERTLADMRALAKLGARMSPWIEIGAERGQRSLVVENDLGIHGAALDLSFDMLRSAEHWGRVFDRPRMPLRVCCDVYHLPFRTGSLPFAFCYETLHHFPEPGPVLQEIHRVLAPGGTLYFEEEPFHRRLRFNLLPPQKVYGKETLRANPVKRVIQKLFSEPALNEVAYGIIENHSIPISTWSEALSIFEGRNVSLTSIRRITAPLYGNRNPVLRGVQTLLGGSIGGTCTKHGNLPATSPALEDALACPTCVARGSEHPVRESAGDWHCAGCGAVFPARDGVVFLLDAGKRHELYPELEAEPAAAR